MEEQVNTEAEVTNEEVPTGEEIQDDVQLASDKADAENQAKEDAETDWKAKYEELEEKNRKAEEIAKKLKDEKSQTKQQEAESAKEAEKAQIQTEFAQTAIQEAMEAGDFSEEALAKAEELGVDSRDLKLQLYEAKENLNTLYDAAGGKDAYYNMVDAVKEVATEQEVAKFKSALSNPEYAELAMYALKAKYAEATGGQQVSNDRRITTNNATSGKSSGYKTMQEYQADMRAMRKLPSTQQSSYYQKIQAKLNSTNESWAKV
jgi:hypothetical protein